MIHDNSGKHITYSGKHGDSMQQCMDDCIKNKLCNAFQFDGPRAQITGPDTISRCWLLQSNQLGQFDRDEKWTSDPNYRIKETYVTGILCSFEAHNKPTRQPDNKYTLEGKS